MLGGRAGPSPFPSRTWGLCAAAGTGLCPFPGARSPRALPGCSVPERCRQGWRNSGLEECRAGPAPPAAGIPVLLRPGQGRYRHHTQTCAGSPEPDSPEAEPAGAGDARRRAIINYSPGPSVRAGSGRGGAARHPLSLGVSQHKLLPGICSQPVRSCCLTCRSAPSIKSASQEALV